MITNGICSFSPTSTKGKWIFVIQTVMISFTPIVVLLAQNAASFYDIMIEKDLILHKNDMVINWISNLKHWYYVYLQNKTKMNWQSIFFLFSFKVRDAMGLATFVLSLQWERAAVSLSVFVDSRTGVSTDLSKEYEATNDALRNVQWRPFGEEKVFENPLRFQIRIDDFRWVMRHEYAFVLTFKKVLEYFSLYVYHYIS